MSDFLQERAKDYLAQQFSDVVGHTLLVDAACPLFDDFTRAFLFSNADITSAESHSSSKRGQVEMLLTAWYRGAPKNEQLKQCLKRWKHKELLQKLGFEGDVVAQPVIVAKPAAQVDISPPAEKNGFLQELREIQRMLSVAMTNNAILSQKLAEVIDNHEKNLIKK